MYTKLLSVLLVSLLALSPIAVADAHGLSFQNIKSHDYVSLETPSKKDHKDNSVKVDDRDDDEDDEGDDNRSPPPGSIYSVNATGEATTKPKGHGNADKKDKDNEGKGKDKGKGKNSEVEDASLNLRAEVEKSSKGRIKLKILSGTVEIGDTRYDIEKGKGKINKKNDHIDFKAKASSQGKDLELILKGERDGTIPLNLGNAPATVEFTSPQSKLASKWFLDLSGRISIGSVAPPPPPHPGPNRTVLTITKSVNASTVLGGGTLRYLITFTNTGNSPARNINVTDSLPASVALVSTNGSIVSLSGSMIKFAAGNLSKGVSKSIILIVNVTGTTPDKTLLKNNASVAWKNVDGSIGGPVNTMAVTTVQAPSLQIVKRVNASSAIPGNALLYTLRVNNTGSTIATINLNDTLPANVTLLSKSPAPNSTIGNTLMWSFVLAPNGTITITVLVRVNSSIGPQTLTNTARALYQNNKGVVFLAISSQTSTSILSIAMMNLQKSVNATSALGGSGLRYILSFANTGNGTATKVNITDTLPSYTTFVSTNGTGVSISGHTITFMLGNISTSSGGKIAIIVKVNGTTPDQTILRNNVTLRWKNPSGSVAMVNATASTTINAPVLVIMKSVNATTANAGHHLFYNITIINNGHADAIITLNDTLPAGVTVNSTSMAPNIISGTSYIWNTLTLAPGGKVTITILVKVSTVTSGTITNTAIATYRNVNDIEFPQESDQKSTLITAP